MITPMQTGEVATVKRLAAELNRAIRDAEKNGTTFIITSFRTKRYHRRSPDEPINVQTDYGK